MNIIHYIDSNSHLLEEREDHFIFIFQILNLD